MEDYLDWLALEDPTEQILVLLAVWNKVSPQQQEKLLSQFAPDLLATIKI